MSGEMKEMTMLDLSKLDVSELAQAFEDNSDEHSWWLDPDKGTVELYMRDVGDDAVDPEERGWLYIEPIGSHEAYRDLEEFTALVRDPKARELLQRAIAGRGAFRRFKDTLFDFPELREAWFQFHDVRMERRAIDWLAAHELIDRAAADRAIGGRHDPDLPEISGAFDAEAIARGVAADLRKLYGDRLRTVLLYGSWARGDADSESDIDILVVLADLDDSTRWDELARMNDIMWRHSIEHGTVVTALPVSTAEFEQRAIPVLINARRDGVKVA